MKRAGIDFGFSRTTPDSVVSIYHYFYKYNDDKPVKKRDQQVEKIIKRIELQKGLKEPEVYVGRDGDDFVNGKRTIRLRYTEIDKL